MIATNDKTVSWDGELLLYKTESFLISDLLSVIPVQVKSHRTNAPNKEHPIRKEDLMNFKLKQFVIFFVVYLPYDGSQPPKIYYKKMFRFDLEKMISSFDAKQKTKVFSFEEFPSDPAKILSLLERIANDAQKINNLMGNVRSVSDYVKQFGASDPFSFDLRFPDKNISLRDFCAAIEEQKPYVYYHDKRTDTCFTIDSFAGDKVSAEIRQVVEVEIDNQLVYSTASMVTTSTNQRLTLGESIEITISGRNANLSYHLSGAIDERINALRFLCGILNQKKLRVGGRECHYSGIRSSVDAAELQNYLDFWCKTKDILEYFHVLKKPYDLDSCDDAMARMVIDIHKCIFECEILESNTIKSGLLVVDLFGLKLLCMCVSNNGKAVIYDFFNEKNAISLSDTDGKRSTERSSPFLALAFFEDDPFKEIDNIDYEIMISSIFSKPLCQCEKSIANRLLLKFIHHCDSLNDSSLLNWAVSFAKKLDEVCSNSISKINLMQCIARQRKLSKDETVQLASILERESDSSIRFGCYVLMGEHENAKRIFASLPPEKKTELESFPIFLLYKDSSFF